MTEKEFLAALRQYLQQLPQEEIDEIIADQEEYFREAITAGRSEEEVAASLGDPKLFAKQCILDTHTAPLPQQISLKLLLKKILSMLVLILALAPFNLLLLLGPFLLLLIFLGLAWLCAAALFIFPIAAPVYLPITAIIAIFSPAYLLFSLGCLMLGISASIVVYHLSRFFALAVWNIIKWNICLIQQKHRS